MTVAAINKFLGTEELLITYWFLGCDFNRSHIQSVITT